MLYAEVLRLCYAAYREFTSVNVCSKALRERRKLLLYGECVRDEHPGVFREFSEGRVALAVCLEREHMNIVGFKLAGLLARLELEELVVLTVDGSPHCVQLHFVAEEAERVSGKEVPRRHFVIEGGRALEIEPEYVKIARYLSRVKRLAERINTRAENR